jgi:hypothetical protein
MSSAPSRCWILSRTGINTGPQHRHNPDIIRHRAFPRDAPRLIDEISSEPSPPDGCAKPWANKFRWSVLKMRQALTFLVTFTADHRGHENTGRHIDPGAAHHLGGRLYRSVAGLGSAYGAAGELTPAVGVGVGDKRGERCFRWISFSGLSACQRFSWLSISQRRSRAADSRKTDAPWGRRAMSCRRS